MVAWKSIGFTVHKLYFLSRTSVGRWRYLSGSWRCFYEVADHEHVVSMIVAFHRDSAY